MYVTCAVAGCWFLSTCAVDGVFCQLVRRLKVCPIGVPGVLSRSVWWVVAGSPDDLGARTVKPLVSPDDLGARTVKPLVSGCARRVSRPDAWLVSPQPCLSCPQGLVDLTPGVLSLVLWYAVGAHRVHLSKCLDYRCLGRASERLVQG